MKSSISPKAIADMERDERLKKSTSKAIFTDFSLPKHHGKGRPQDLVPRTNPASRNSSRYVDHLDIVSGHVQTTLQTVET